jgi:hypothetical protein
MLGRLSLMRFFCYCANSRESIGRYVVEVQEGVFNRARTPAKTVIRSAAVENRSNFPSLGNCMPQSQRYPRAVETPRRQA